MPRPARPRRVAAQDSGGRWGTHPVAVSAIAATAAALIALMAWLFPRVSKTALLSPGPLPTTTSSSTLLTAPATTTTSTTTPPQPACGKPITIEGISAAFVDPCDEAIVDDQYPVVKVKVPHYPEAGRLMLVMRVLTDQMGTPLNPTPIYGQSPIDPRTARAEFSKHGVWGKDITIGTSDCTQGGRVELILLFLSPEGAAEATTWQPGIPLTIPAGSHQLDSILVTRTDTSC